MKIVSGLLGLVVGLSACSTTLPFKPETPGSAVSANYIILADQVRVEVDTGGYRLEDTQLVTTSGAVVRPQAIESPPPGTGSSVGLGVGMGGTNYRRGGAVGVGTGVGVEMPVGSSNRVQGHTVLYFRLDQTGPPPWQLHVKAADSDPVTILLPPR